MITERGVHIFLAPISWTLARMQSLARRAAERNQELRTLLELEIAELGDSDLFVPIDEKSPPPGVNRPSGLGRRSQKRGM